MRRRALEQIQSRHRFFAQWAASGVTKCRDWALSPARGWGGFV
jgi:hypothetical protein